MAYGPGIEKRRHTMSSQSPDYVGHVLNFKDDLPQHPDRIPYLAFALQRVPAPTPPHDPQPVLSVDLRQAHAKQCVSVIPFAWAEQAMVEVYLDKQAGAGLVKRVEYAPHK